MLAKHFIDRFCRDLNKKPLVLAPSAVQELQEYQWPGNVRELQNCIERAVILTEGDTIHARHLSLSFREVPLQPPAPGDDGTPWSKIDLTGTMADATRRVVSEVERRKIDQALRESAGNRNRAADLLQISYKTLLAKLKEYGLET
jgi:two-component system response regulator AtoC